MAEVLGTDLLLLNRPDSLKTYKISVDELPIPSGGAAVYIGPNPPYAIDSDDENNGDLWWDTETGVLYIYYIESNESDSSFSKQWVQAAAAYGTVNKLGDLTDVNGGTAPEDTQGLVWDADSNSWAPGVVGTSFIDLSNVDSTAFALSSSNRLPPTDNITDQAKANEWFVKAIGELDDKKLEASDVSIHPGVADVLIDGAAPTADGTAADPIILTTNTVTLPGGYELCSQKIKFINQTPNSLVIFHDTNHVQNGRRFDQDVEEIDSAGEIEIQLEYLDSPITTGDTTYVGIFRVNELYFKWEVEQKGVDLSVSSPTVISGTTYVYSVLHAIPAQVIGGSGLTHTIVWYSSTDDTNWLETGYEGTTYTIRPVDENQFIKAETVSVDSSGVVITSESTSLGPVTYDLLSTRNPIILGSNIIGTTLTLIGSSESDENISVIEYQWKRDGVDIQGENNTFYELVSDDHEKSISVTESVDDGHNSVSKNSNEIVARFAQPVISQCAVTGVPTPGSALSLIGGLIVAGGSGNFTTNIQWYRDDITNPIAGANAISYVTTSDDHKHSIFATKKIVDDTTNVEVESTSNPLYVQYDRIDSTRPGIKGRFKENETLSAIPGDVRGGSGSYSISYAWISNGAEISTGKDFIVTTDAFAAGSIFVRESIEDTEIPGTILYFDSVPLEVSTVPGILDDLSDVEVSNASSGDILIKSGNIWTYADPVALPELLTFAGFIDVNIDSPPSTFTKNGITYNSLPAGTTYIQHKVDSAGSVITPTQFNNQWPDIPAGTPINEGQYVILGTEGKWHKGGQSVLPVQSDFKNTDITSAEFIKNKPVKVSDFTIDIDYNDVHALRSDISGLTTLP